MLQTQTKLNNNQISDLVPRFIEYAQFELGLSPQTITKYKESLNWLQKDLDYIKTVELLELDDITTLKKKMQMRGVGACRVNSIIFALRKFLIYCKEIRKINTINPQEIKPMKVARRQVEFLTKEEIQQLLNSINTKDKRGLRMRALMELLLATGMRIGEALSLDIADINWPNKEAMIVGKGNKQRTVFLTDRAVYWLQEYLAKRNDTNPALFITFGRLTRLTRFDLSKQFKHYAQKAGLTKRLTPHILRHTMATLMLNNGANLFDIKEMLGHSSIETTARHYLGTDKKTIKESHAKYLKFD